MFCAESHCSDTGQPFTDGGCDGRCAQVVSTRVHGAQDVLRPRGGSVPTWLSIGVRFVARQKPTTCSTGPLTRPAFDFGEKNASDLNSAFSSGFSSYALFRSSAAMASVGTDVGPW